MARDLLGSWDGAPARPTRPSQIVDGAATTARRIRVVHRPGAVQTEIRIGHSGPAAPRSRTSTRSRS